MEIQDMPFANTYLYKYDYVTLVDCGPGGDRSDPRFTVEFNKLATV